MPLSASPTLTWPPENFNRDFPSIMEELSGGLKVCQWVFFLQLQNPVAESCPLQPGETV